jgi:regulator of RNase E activity RraA
MPSDQLATKFLSVDTTALCDADKATRVLDSAIRARSATTRICGPAYTVRCRDDFFAVIVVDGGGNEIALAGELFARGALARNLGGIIIDAGYRDITYVRSCELPIYSRFITPMAGTTAALGDLQIPITCGGVPIAPGDLILADDEGIIVLDPTRAEALLDSAAAIKEAEASVIARLNAGSHLSDGLNVAEHTKALLDGKPSSLEFLT